MLQIERLDCHISVSFENIALSYAKFRLNDSLHFEECRTIA